ncbi:uncharacterized protein PV09_05600 [Verruconis gallopava]|uniref:Anaphase-promoting complex subunit 4 WD40 domain-containing protein n=1 Tax=Verruconis gallopava TaxID=253628 RepID=A0A0D2A9G7_9PEZI|nr:uncharacterized protein PV09_05600 [Verruconis gallopava]KIW03393.1 hypothetical protein PV09_05600 [Verruconis gallopava]
MAKRKREDALLQPGGARSGKTRKIAAVPGLLAQTHIQIVVGSYEKILHGIIAAIPAQVLQPAKNKVGEKPTWKENVSRPNEDSFHEMSQESNKDDPEVTFADSFLFTAHTSAVRCLTLSPVPAQDDIAQKVVLATGSNDARINLYTLSTTPPDPPKKGAVPLPSISGVKVSQNALNKELGYLNHHNSSITALCFPTRSKLLSASEDNTIAISRTRDWTVLSTIKAPTPKAQGRPSGDTAAPGEVPAGVNDFAVHPSMKLMISVGKGEKCMRLWNLVTGKKAGVLNFEKGMLHQVGEGKYGTGEGRRIIWDEAGEEFVVAFERGAVAYDMDCKVRSRICPWPPSKVHQMCYVPNTGDENVLCVSTEDGRILFFDTASQSDDVNGTEDTEDTTRQKDIPHAKLLAQMGGRATGVASRVKDFAVLSSSSRNDGALNNLVFVTGCSDGTIRLWLLSSGELDVAREVATKEKIPQVGHLLARYDTGNRITCLTAFIMNERVDTGSEAKEAEFGGFSTGVKNDESDSEDSESDY